MNVERLYTVILGPHVSEKTTLLGEANNQYAFKVAIDARKIEIKEAVETLFNVVVADLQVLNVKGKTKRNAKGKIRRGTSISSTGSTASCGTPARRVTAP